MSFAGRIPEPLRIIPTLIVIISVLAVLIAGGLTGDRSVSKIPPPPKNASQSVAMGAVSSPVPSSLTLQVSTPAPSKIATPAPAVNMSPENLLKYTPNELGVVPILEYHMITTNPEEEAQFVRMADDMRADLQWLYEHDFYIVSLRDVVSNSIAVPAGKHPVALTFDDATSTQFAFIENDSGELVPDPDTAMGILEAFYDKHPDFGRGGHFGILVYNGFANPDESQEPYLQQKIDWMVDRGYEIGNHTWQHTNLTDISTEEFMMTVGEPMVWADENVGDVPENQSRILTLPYGTSPDGDLHPDQRKMMREGMTYKGETYYLDAALLVGAEPSLSPANSDWDPMWIPRIQMFDESVAFWFDLIESGGLLLYTSDGDPDTVVVPAKLPDSLEAQLNEEALAADGRKVIRYDSGTGEITSTKPKTP